MNTIIDIDNYKDELKNIILSKKISNESSSKYMIYSTMVFVIEKLILDNSLVGRLMLKIDIISIVDMIGKGSKKNLSLHLLK